MQDKKSDYPHDWFRIGDKEIKRAEILLGFNDLEGAGFNIQQALEKYLKGFLLSKAWSLRKIHELDVLLNDAIVYEPSLVMFREACLKITEYYLEERYPSTEPSQLRTEEVAQSLKSAREMIAKIRSLIT